MEKKFILIFLLAFVVLPAALAIGQGEVIKTPNLQNYSHKKLLKLQAIPAPGWKFSHWEGDIQGNSNPVSFLITEEIHATAVFTEEGIYTLSVTNEGKGTVNISPSKTIFNPGAEVTLTAVAKPGWRFDRWEGATTGSQNPVVLSIQSDVSVKAVFVNLARIAAGGSHSLALLEDGTVWAWGDNSFGQLGDGTDVYVRDTPKQVLNISNAVAVAGGSGHSLALLEDGTVWAWGDNSSGQLGDGTTADRTTPVQVTGLSSVVAIAAGGGHSLALNEAGTVWAWGDNSSAQAGDMDGHPYISYPSVVIYLDNTGVAIAAGNTHSLALFRDGTIWAWGDNSSGQLGLGSIDRGNIPMPVDINNIAAIEVGSEHFLALKEDGTVWAWGDNFAGRLGDGTTANRTTPVQVLTINNIEAIAAGDMHSLALKDDGTVWAWGSNQDGQLGGGPSPPQKAPVQVAGLSNVEAIAAGGAHSLALKADGTVWAWGDNRAGQLADREAAIARLTPIQAKDISEVETIAAGFSNSLSLKKDGTVWVWGSIYGGDRMRYVRPYPSIMNIFISP